MPVGRRAVAAAQQGEPVVEPPVDVGDRHGAHPGGGELDGQRQAVEPAHDAQHARGSRATPGRAARARWPKSSDAASSSSWESGKTRSAAMASGARVVVTTRRSRAGRDEEGHQVGDGLDDVLAVVEDEQGRRTGQGLGGPGAHVGALLGREHPAAAHRVAHPQRRADLTDDVVGGGDADQLDEVHDRLLGLAAEEVREPGLAQAAGPEDRHDAGLADQGAQGSDVVVATDQRGRLVAQPAPDRVVGGEQLGVHRSEGRAGVDAQALGEVAPHARVPVERGRAAVHRGERAQQGSGGRLVADTGLLEQREGLTVVAEGAQRPAEHRAGLRTQPARVVAQRGQRTVTTGCRCRATQRPPGRVTSGRPVAASLGGGRRGHVVTQGERVDGRLGQPEAVAAGDPLHDVGGGLGAGARHHDLQRLGRVGGCLVGPPHLVDERALTESAAVGLDQGRQQGVRASAVHGRTAPGDLAQEPQRTGRRVPVLGVGLRHPPSLGGARVGAGQPGGVRVGKGTRHPPAG